MRIARILGAPRDFWAALQLGGFITMLLGATSFPKATTHEVSITPLMTPDARGLAVSGAF